MKIGIIGLGLIGGSLFKDLSKNYDVIAVSQSQDGERIFKTYDVLKDRDIVFVCTPMNKTLKVLDELENYLSPETIVTDVCSLKEFVCKKERPYIFIPSHPMAGTEHKGFENSFEGLFKGAKWVVIEEDKRVGSLEDELVNDSSLSEISHTQHLDNSLPSYPPILLPSIHKLIELIRYVGAEPVFTTAREHDKAVAMISHMPMVLAQALVLSIKDNPLAKEIAASGFRDMTRLALSNEEMACDMVSMNSKNIEHAILNLYKSMGELTSGNYPEIIKELKQIRSNMYS
jgi:prephenate dehydrogenase